MGSENDLELSSDLPRPILDAESVIVMVSASGITTADYRNLMTAGPPPLYQMRLVLPVPIVVGIEYAGTIVEVGSNVKGFAVGDQVYGCKGIDGHGTFAEYVAIHPTKHVIHQRPDSVPVNVAALHAHGLSLTDKPGQKSVLVLAADSDIGVWAVKISKRLGAVVTVVVGTHRRKFAESVGADHVYESANLVAGKFDILFDAKGEDEQGSHWALSQRVLKAFGLYTFSEVLSGENVVTKKLKRTFASTITYSPATFLFDVARASTQIAEWLADGSITGIPVTIISFEDAKEVHLKRAAGEIAGKSVLLL
ncbi:hypothetical protein HK100_011864 [Physocladia obscura]|uniref:Enoyl reductase (ER) domain-containing protein n=1 Tax=Physocladia obscura TaxID=109957 RepID=A0AAD5T3I3_9FUNG|nr:hypothetical protein HK100_011864 [Physocladia obscura]